MMASTPGPMEQNSVAKKILAKDGELKKDKDAAENKQKESSVNSNINELPSGMQKASAGVSEENKENSKSDSKVMISAQAIIEKLKASGYDVSNMSWEDFNKHAKKCKKDESLTKNNKSVRATAYYLATKKRDQLGKIQFKELLQSYNVDPEGDLKNVHAHHILYKVGAGEEQQAIVTERREILEKYDIDVFTDRDNLVWAPNVEGQHIKENLQEVVEAIKKAEKKGQSRYPIELKLITKKGIEISEENKEALKKSMVAKEIRQALRRQGEKAKKVNKTT